MKTSHKVAVGISKFILVISALLFVGSIVFLKVVGQPEQTKQLLKDSELYSITAQKVRSQFIQGDETAQQVSGPLVEDAINKSLSDETIQNIAEDGIDTTYAWLDGKTDNPQIKIDVDAIKANFANHVTQNIEARLATLPACSRSVVPTTNDITAIECIPRGYNTAAEVEKVRQQILATDANNLLGQDAQSNPGNENTATTSQQIEQESQQSISQNLAPIKSTYTWVKRLPLISGVLFVVAVAVIAVFSQPRYRALRTLGLAAIPLGLLYLLLGFISQGTVKGVFALAEKQAGANEFQKPLQHISQHFANLISGYFSLFGIGLLLVGVILFVTYKVIQKRTSPTTPEKTPPSSNPSESPQTQNTSQQHK